jgi:uncharacterized protein YutE (UPF0331/DUF86 family)
LESDLSNVLGRKVDLVTTAALRNPHFRHEVEKTRAVIYDATQVAQVGRGHRNRLREHLRMDLASSLSAYSSNAKLHAEVERPFEIIGEALLRLERSDPAVATRISDYRRVIGFRNRLAHGYDDIDAILAEIDR